MNHVEREVEGLRPDVVMVGAGALDNYFLPFDASQDEYIRGAAVKRLRYIQSDCCVVSNRAGAGDTDQQLPSRGPLGDPRICRPCERGQESFFARR